MRFNTNDLRRRVSNTEFGVFASLGQCFFLLLVLLSCAGCRKPPDLVSCARLELRCPDGALDQFFPIDLSTQEGIFSEEERAYIRSFDSWVVEDQDVIKAFAGDVSHGTYSGQLRGKTSPGLKIVCYRAGERLTSFDARYGGIITEDGAIFKYTPRLPDISMLEPTEIQRFKPRWQCALNMGRLYVAGPLLRRKATSYLDANQWCDTIVEALQSQYLTYAHWGQKKKRTFSDTDIAKRFTCMGARESPEDDTEAHPGEPHPPNRIRPIWESYYAMNRHCEPDSPPDMVLLFETKAGWNQHGGPELFTFDNHEPKGGCVLLNDGTVRFIRTKEELQQLRWE
ncbi:MAG: hypothetical protein ACYTAO_18305 [Planctomycetota bacterium]|jgi:hypothetical protein